MSQPIHELDYLALSPAERLLLAQELLDSVYDNLTPAPPAEDEIAWARERVAAVDADAVSGSSWEETKARIEACRNG